MSVEGTVSSKDSPKVTEPLPTPGQDIEDVDDSNDTISGRTKSISEQLSKVKKFHLSLSFFICFYRKLKRFSSRP